MSSQSLGESISLSKQQIGDPLDETYYTKQKYAPAAQAKGLKLKIKKLSTEKS